MGKASQDQFRRNRDLERRRARGKSGRKDDCIRQGGWDYRSIPVTSVPCSEQIPVIPRSAAIPCHSEERSDEESAYQVADTAHSPRADSVRESREHRGGPDPLQGHRIGDGRHHRRSRRPRLGRIDQAPLRSPIAGTKRGSITAWP